MLNGSQAVFTCRVGPALAMDEVNLVHRLSPYALPEERKCWMADPKARSTHPVQYLSAYFEKRLEVGDSTSSASGETLSRFI
jgi:hypothetical protein